MMHCLTMNNLKPCDFLLDFFKLYKLMLQLKTPKQLLASVRQGDYAHPGEEAAINLVLKYMMKSPDQLLLDVGCGLGGTARYIKDYGYGIPFGIDIDKTAITYAKQKYSDIWWTIVAEQRIVITWCTVREDSTVNDLKNMMPMRKRSLRKIPVYV